MSLPSSMPVVWLLLVSVAAVLDAAARAAHLHVIGQPKTGKSRALESWILQDIQKGHGVGVIDPHGDLFNHLLAYVAMLSRTMPQMVERLVIIDPLDPKWTVGINPLRGGKDTPPERVAGYFMDVVTKVWRIDATQAPRMVRVLTKCTLALAKLGLTLVDLERFLLDRDWRSQLLVKLDDLDLLQYFRKEFPATQSGVLQWAEPVINKVGAFSSDPDVRLMLAADATIDFRRMLDEGKILLVNLSKGILGEGTSALVGAFIVALIQKAALGRADEKDEQFRKTFYFYLDEFQQYTTDNIQDILAESRKYGLSLVLAHQYLEQLPSTLRAAVLNITLTQICFRIGYHDASILVHDLFPPDFFVESISGWQLAPLGDITAVPLPAVSQEPLSHEKIAAVLTSLRNREFWVKHRGPTLPVKQKTLTMPPIVWTDELRRTIAWLRDESGMRYGRLKTDVRKELTRDRLDADAAQAGAASYTEQTPPAAPVRARQQPAKNGTDGTGRGHASRGVPVPPDDAGADRAAAVPARPRAEPSDQDQPGTPAADAAISKRVPRTGRRASGPPDVGAQTGLPPKRRGRPPGSGRAKGKPGGT